MGCRYYDGVAHKNEYVEFVREPGNPYDSNAIRVDNMAGVQVGHIKREQAAALAPIMDSGASPSPTNPRGWLRRERAMERAEAGCDLPWEAAHTLA